MSQVIKLRTPQGDEYLIDMSDVSHGVYIPADVLDDEIDSMVEVLVYFKGHSTPLTLMGESAQDFWKRSSQLAIRCDVEGLVSAAA